MKKPQPQTCRSCRTCRDYRPGAPEARGYEGCAWCRTPVLQGVDLPVTRWVGAVRCVRADQADLERGCKEWREDVDPFARTYKSTKAERVKQARYRANKRGPIVGTCPICGRPRYARNQAGRPAETCGRKPCQAASGASKRAARGPRGHQ